ncbi:Uncharacterised protein [Mycobacteroides abscessus subsp. massiliense]|nr:Uncharacterised protein [Mycobacteroides abscessus subsp. massiliense]
MLKPPREAAANTLAIIAVLPRGVFPYISGMPLSTPIVCSWLPLSDYSKNFTDRVRSAAARTCTAS